MRTSRFDSARPFRRATRPSRDLSPGGLACSRAALAPLLGWALTTGAVATEPLPLAAKAGEVLPARHEAPRPAQTVQRQFPAGAVSRLNIDIPAGDLQIYATDERELAQIRVIRTAWHERCILDVGHDGDRAWARVSLDGGGRMPCRVDLRVDVTQNTRVFVQLASGDVRVSGLAGELTTDIGAGDLLIDELSGPLDAEMGSGQLLGVYKGPRLRAEVGSGLVRLDGMHAPADVTVGMGNVELSYSQAPVGTVDVRAGTGSVRVLLPPDSPVRTAVNVGMGSQRVRLPEQATALTRVNVVTGMGRVVVEGRPEGEPDVLRREAVDEPRK